MDLTQTWVYAPLPETQADAVKLGDSLRVVMPSGATVQGKVIAKAAEADFATQRDINGGRKRDIKTVRLKLLIPNPGREVCAGHDGRGVHPQGQAGEAMTSHAQTVTPTPDPLHHAAPARDSRGEHREEVWRLRSGEGRELRSGGGRDLRPAGSEWRGEEHADPHDDDADSGDQRAGAGRRSRCEQGTECGAAT